ncbi:MAG TPA: ABC transporter substrate binding protein, partial [Pyrinomonadaceae bacterium]|nr:ABC transporter substrate binding protein [Pyrinomonadaceae bacterium]
PEGSIEYYPEYLESNRFPGDDQEAVLHAYLKQKYARRHIDVVVAGSDTPLQFLLKYRDDLFPNTPIVFNVVRPPDPKEFETGGGLTGVINTFSFKQTLDLALGLHPDTKQVFIISGTLDHSKLYERMARERLQGYESRVSLNYLTDLSAQELLEKTRSLPDHSIILYAWQQAYGENNKLLETFDILPLVTASARVPVYGLASWQIGKGIVGGYARNNSEAGTRVAEMAVQLANGQRPQDVPVESTAVLPMFDWAQLKRWGINEQQLPTGSIVQFKRPTFWEEDRWYIIGAAAAILLEAVLIAFLLITLQRVRSAEREQARLMGETEAAHRRLDETVSNVPGIVWEAMIDPNTNQRRTTFISDHVYKMLGYTPEEWLAEAPGLGARLMHEDDRDRALQESDDVVTGGHDGFSQFRWRTRDGRYVWTENYLIPIFDRDQKVVGLRGVAIDVTDRKKAEETARLAEEKDRAILEAIPDLMFMQTRDGVYLDHHCNNPEDLLLPPEAFIGKNMREVLPPELVDRLTEAFEQAIETRETQLVEYELEINDEPRWFEARIVSSGENILSVIRDITQRVLAEEAIKRSEAQLAGVIGSAMDGIITIDKNQKIILFNESAERIFGCPASQAVGHSLDRFIPERYRTAHRHDLEAFGTREVTRRMMGDRGTELYGLKLSGEEFPMEASISQIEVDGQKFYTVILRDITERKRAENELAASHRKVNEILESIGDAFYSVDSDLRFTYVNRKTEELWALRRQDLIGRSFLDVFPQAIGTDSHRVIMRALDEGRPINFEGLSPIINRWVDVSVYPTPAGLSIYFRDATERKEAENALRESESRLQRAQQAARVATWEWNLATGESLWSEMLWHLLGLEPGDGEATVERFLEFIHPEDREQTWQVANEAIEHDKPYDHEFRILRNDGEVLWLASKGRVIRSSDGKPDRMIGVNIDVTDRHRALDEIRESHERFAKAFRANPQPMSLTVVATGEYLDVNDSFLQVSGYRRDEVIGKTSLELNIWELPEAREAFVAELRDRGSLVNRETKLRTRDGSMRVLLSSAEQLEIDGRHCLLVASSDITERMLAQQALRESEARFRNMADTAPVMIWIADINKAST